MEVFRISLAAARVNAKLTQGEVARELKISNRTINNWETGRTMPKADMVAKLCELYGIGYDNLIFLRKDSV